MEWVTRQGVRLDRAAMIWLIRREIDSEATITILPEGEVLAHAATTGATPFHHPGAELRHQGSRTGFDSLRTHYNLTDPALAVMALIHRGAETSDKSLTQWSPGVVAIANGIRKACATDDAYLAAITPVLDGLYLFCQDLLAAPGKPTAK